jgi:hypothetical protein
MLIVFVLVAVRFRLRAGVAAGRLQHELPCAGVRWPGHRGCRDLESLPLAGRAARAVSLTAGDAPNSVATCASRHREYRGDTVSTLHWPLPGPSSSPCSS